MIEKFGYYITSTNNIKIFRIIGDFVAQADGSTAWNTDMTKVARSYRYPVQNKIQPYGTWRNRHKVLYDTRADAESAAQTEVRSKILREIGYAKQRMQSLEAKLDNVKVAYHDCGK